MTMTLEMLAARVEILEKQMATISLDTASKDKKDKKDKKEKPADDKPKKKRTSGYIIFSKAHRDEVKSKLAEADDKPKNTDIMVELAKLWKALTDEDRETWNAKAKEIKEAETED